MNEFSFESYGVKIRVECSSNAVCDTAFAVVNKALLGRKIPIDRDEAEHVFTLRTDGNRFFMHLDGNDLGDGDSEFIFFKYFDTRIRILVAEYAVGYVFMHAGVVAWNGKLIIFPANSYSGKTTLVAEFVKKGAVYYSDEYAVIDQDGYVHPFPRLLAMRDRNGNYEKTEVSAESLGGNIGLDPMPISLVLLTRYKPRARWAPKVLTSGVGVMKMILQAISLRFRSKLTLEVLNKVASNAIIAESLRNSTENSVNKIIEFVDNL